LKPDQVATLWADPLLRQTNVLDGLFHSAVAVCEADGDCQFYSATALALAEEKDRASPDVLFVHCGGKDRMAKIVSALRAVDVPIVAIPDFDVLREDRPLKPLYEALGGNWSDISDDLIVVRNAVTQKRPQLDARDFKKQIEERLAKITAHVVSDDVLEEIRGLAKQASAWGNAKQLGEGFIPNGEPYNAYVRIKKKCSKAGLHIVPVGELESFCKSIGRHGPPWVIDVMKRDLVNDPDLAQARSFVAEVFSLN
jgi:hypothetical protein